MLKKWAAEVECVIQIIVLILTPPNRSIPLHVHLYLLNVCLYTVSVTNTQCLKCRDVKTGKHGNLSRCLIFLCVKFLLLFWHFVESELVMGLEQGALVTFKKCLIYYFTPSCSELCFFCTPIFCTFLRGVGGLLPTIFSSSISNGSCHSFHSALCFKEKKSWDFSLRFRVVKSKNKNHNNILKSIKKPILQGKMSNISFKAKKFKCWDSPK